MKHRRIATLVAIFAIASGSLATSLRAAAQPTAENEPPSPVELPTTVVTATRVATEVENVGRVVATRTDEDFDLQQSLTASDQLQTVAGLRTQEIGGPGAPGVTPFEIRGFRSSGTQFLINGLRFNDPSSVGGTADSIVSYMTTNDIQSIEVLKGASSVLYGSDGQAGAINFITKRPEAGQGTEFSIQGGSFGTVQEYANVNFGDKEGGVFASLTRIDADGIDSNGEYENTTGFLNGVAALSETFTINPFFRVVDARNDLDRGPTLNAEQTAFLPSTDSGSDRVDVRHIFYGVSGTYQPSDLMQSRLALGINDIERGFLFDFGFGATPFDYKGESINLDWQNSYSFPDIGGEIIGGIDYEHQSAESISSELRDTGSQDRYGAFGKYRQSLLDNALTLDGGVRITHVSSIQRTLPTLELSGVYKMESTETRIHSSIAQGFRAPTLYETDGLTTDFLTNQIINIGNRNLKEERTITFDLGVEQKICGWATADVTFFTLESDDTILFDFENETHVNGGGTKTRGVENSLTMTPADWLLVRGAHTYLAEVEGLNGTRTQRRPYNSWALSAAAKWEKFTLFTEYRYRGGQNLAFFGTSDLFREDSAGILDSTLSYSLTPALQLFVRADNLLDKDYTEGGYRMPGSGYFGGLRFKL